ncbi:hypothetical protein SRABI06_00347 [Pseudomonas brassicacearum]|nr:hypothetical protein SRABI06_00347 [Pseudomonas brassicacearum]
MIPAPSTAACKSDTELSEISGPVSMLIPCLGAWHYAPTGDGHADRSPWQPRHCNIAQSMSISRANFWIDAERQTRKVRSGISTHNPYPSSERPRICHIRAAHPVYGGALNTSHGHPGPCRKSPFAIACKPGVNGGITGGIIRFSQAVTTALEPSQNVFRRPGQPLKDWQHGLFSLASIASANPNNETALPLVQSAVAPRCPGGSVDAGPHRQLPWRGRN